MVGLCLQEIYLTKSVSLSTSILGLLFYVPAAAPQAAVVLMAAVTQGCGPSAAFNRSIAG